MKRIHNPITANQQFLFLLFMVWGVQSTLLFAKSTADNCGTPKFHTLAEVLARRVSYDLAPKEQKEQWERDYAKWQERFNKLNSGLSVLYPERAKQVLSAIYLERMSKYEKLITNANYHENLRKRGKYGHLTPEDVRDIPERGDIQILDSLHNEETDTQAFVLKDNTSGETFIVFRGTASLNDWWLNKGGLNGGLSGSLGGVGTPQFTNDEVSKKLKDWSQSYPNSIVVGHSLGGALGQHYVAHYPDKVKKGIFFNSAGVDQWVVDEYNKNLKGEKGPTITYHLHGRDLVSNAGGRTMLSGKVVFHNTASTEGSNIKKNHTSFMLSEHDNKDCEYFSEEEFDEFLRQRTAYWSQ
ncbi:MAG: alpha/beta hydrolase, partial [Devosiaceae bacterium]|nr:alpha/beta hydrolase [Devosiaceae bacterium]